MQKLWDTLLRLAVNNKQYKGFMGLLCLWSLFVCFACSRQSHSIVDKLNTDSYAFHYKNLDSTYINARKAYYLSKGYPSGEAEAMNNIAFVNIAKMNFSLAAKQLDSIYTLTDNQLELLIADVQYMRLCQRKAQNKDFYDYKVRAQQRIKRIKEEEGTLSPRETKRLLYGETEYSFVLSTYYYYVGLDSLATDAIIQITTDGLLQKDAAQYLNYLYQCGTGGIIQAKSPTETLQKEYDKLLECYLMSKRMKFKYWEANSMQAISEILINNSNRYLLLEKNKVSVGYLNVDHMPDTLLAGYLAQKATDLFRIYGDTYQEAASLRTLAKCFWAIGDNTSSLFCLEKAINGNKIKQAPDLIASICEQLSIVYSSLNDKHNSDLNRNLYLDLQEKTRQDMELDARAAKLEQTSTILNWMILAILSVIFLVAFLLFRIRRMKTNTFKFEDAINELKLKISSINKRKINDLEEYSEELEENCNIQKLSLEKNKRRNIDNRAKVFLLDNILPLIDRMSNEVNKLKERAETAEQKKERLTYITELSEKINESNNTITEWIELRKGDIGMTIESFRLQELFEILKRSKIVFEMQGKELCIQDTEYTVKADKALTLFMINTLTDNARKYTAQGGKINVYATEQDNCIEISVKDNGCGIADDKLAGIFNRKISNGHGFGLLNCRGILEKYGKYSRIFDVCHISAQSSPNGSRFFFTLPKGIATTVIIMLFCMTSHALPEKKQNLHNSPAKSDLCLNKADTFADSTYFANVHGDYAAALAFADSARIWLNRHYAHLRPNGKDFMHHIDRENAEAPELRWFNSGINTDYNIILDIRNESAIASLALHEWALYRYNNSIYTKLFKEVSADTTIAQYCRIMQRSETDKNIAIVLLIISCVSLSLVTYLMYYRRITKSNSLREIYHELEKATLSNIDTRSKLNAVTKLSQRADVVDNKIDLSDLLAKFLSDSKKENILQAKIQAQQDCLKRMSYENNKFYISNNITENCLSTIKHETMYYPSRIYNYIASTDESSTSNGIETLSSLISYYKELYSILLEQVHRQINNLPFERKTVKIPVCTSEEMNTIGDETLVYYLFKILKTVNGNVAPQYTVFPEGVYLHIQAVISNLNKELTETPNQFIPEKANIPFLIMRQIVRETNSAVNLCKGGINAVKGDSENLTLTITLPYRTEIRKQQDIDE